MNLSNAASSTQTCRLPVEGKSEMKLVSYQQSDNPVHLGAVKGDQVINLNSASGGTLPDDMLRFLQLGNAAMQTAREALEDAIGELPLDAVRLLAPAGCRQVASARAQSQQGGCHRPQLYGPHS
jgi:hypothetical protein